MARIVGLDIGSSAVRAVEVRARGRTTKVVRSGRVALPPGSVEGGQVLAPAEVTKAVRRLWHEQKFSTRAVRLGIGSGSVLVRQVELDWMPPHDLRRAMRYLVGDLLPVPLEEANLDHVLLDEVMRPGEDPGAPPRRMVRVLLVATARGGVDDLVRCVRAAGLRPTTADLSPLALVRAATQHAQHTQHDGGPEALVDVGADKVSVAVHSDGRPHFVRVIPGIGGATLTRALVELAGEEPARAEALKRQGHDGLPVSDATVRHLELATRRVVDEIGDTLAFHTASDPEHTPRRVRLAGLGGLGHGFDDLCAQVTGLPVARLETAASGRAHAGDAPVDDLALALGLCLGGTR